MSDTDRRLITSSLLAYLARNGYLWAYPNRYQQWQVWQPCLMALQERRVVVFAKRPGATDRLYRLTPLGRRFVRRALLWRRDGSGEGEGQA